jgi:hypothetical protein
VWQAATGSLGKNAESGRMDAILRKKQDLENLAAWWVQERRGVSAEI